MLPGEVLSGDVEAGSYCNEAISIMFEAISIMFEAISYSYEVASSTNEEGIIRIDDPSNQIELTSEPKFIIPPYTTSNLVVEFTRVD